MLCIGAHALMIYTSDQTMLGAALIIHSLCYCIPKIDGLLYFLSAVPNTHYVTRRLM